MYYFIPPSPADAYDDLFNAHSSSYARPSAYCVCSVVGGMNTAVSCFLLELIAIAASRRPRERTKVVFLSAKLSGTPHGFYSPAASSLAVDPFADGVEYLAGGIAAVFSSTYP